MKIDEQYMRRALSLARNGLFHASPNPMVGAVIVAPDGRIIGEGWHRRCGEAHAEVNAVQSVADADRPLLRQSTIYVTLEPCAHWGRTGPCAQLIIDEGIPNVVVGTTDPFSKVNGKGISMMRDAGIKVKVGVLENECRSLNCKFFTAHTLGRPFITLKWARSADGWLDCRRTPEEPAAEISTPVTRALVHRLRATHDAILVGSGTIVLDRPHLNVRHWAGRNPRPVILDRRKRFFSLDYISLADPIVFTDDNTLEEKMKFLYSRGITSVLVEGGSKMLHSFIEAGLWDVMREEIAEGLVLGDEGSAPAPSPGQATLLESVKIDGNIINIYSQNSLVDVKNL